MDHTIVHFEIPADDVNKIKNFYGSLFGWKMEKTPGFESMDYHMAMTVPVDDNMQPVRQGVNGGIYKRQDPQTKFTYYVQVDSADEYSKKIEELGGKIVAPKMEIPNMGWVVFALDPEGNAFSIFEKKTA